MTFEAAFVKLYYKDWWVTSTWVVKIMSCKYKYKKGRIQYKQTETKGNALLVRRPLDQDHMISWSGNYNKGEVS